MLRIIANSSESGAKQYYTSGLSKADYYVKGQEVIGQWGGKGAELLGLNAPIDRNEFFALCENRNPATGERLTARTNDKRRVGYDFTFNAPKSLSVAYGLTGDKKLLAAFREAVAETMAELEAEAKARVRKGGENSDRVTGNLVWGEFVHFTARPVDGVPDPHLHAHCFTLNATFDGQEQRWKAAEVGGIKRDASYFEAAFHARLAKSMVGLGYSVRQTNVGWELAGVSDAVVEKFSRRTQLIEEKAKALGVKDPKKKEKLGAKTRERKVPDLSDAELRLRWQARLSDAEADTLARMESSLGPTSQGERTAREGIEHAIRHCFERKSVVSDKELLGEALWHAMGSASVDEVKAEFARSGALQRSIDGRTMVTTKDVIDEEKNMLGFARDGRGSCRRLAPNERILDVKLNDGQRSAVRHAWRSHDRVMVIRGGAGTGKTTMMREAVRGLEASGHRVVPLAPTAEAARDVLRSEGFASADTVARFLEDAKFQEAARGAVLWVDEAGLLGTPTAAKLFRAAEQLDCRVVMMGDVRQHAAVERGDALRLLEQEAGLIAAEVHDIQRQRGDYKQAVSSIAKGDLERGFSLLESMGAIREHSPGDGHAALARDYVSAVEAGRSTLVVSPTHVEAREATVAIREHLKGRGSLSTDERVYTSLVSERLTEAERSDGRNYRPGQVVVFHANAKSFRSGESISIHRIRRSPLATVEIPERGIKRGDRLTVTGVRDGKVYLDDARGRQRILPLAEAKKFDVFRQESLAIAAGDRIRFTRNTKSMDGRHELRNGAIGEVNGFTPEGHVVLKNGWIVDRLHGHLTHGYVVTSHASQGKTVDSVFIAQSAASLKASSAEQFYVSVSRGRREARIYTDDREALKAAVAERTIRLSGTELIRQHPAADRKADRRQRFQQHGLRLMQKTVEAHARVVEKVRDIFREPVRTR